MENGTSSGDRLGEGNGAAIALDLDETHIVPGAGCGNQYCGKARVHEASAASSASTPASASTSASAPEPEPRKIVG